MRALIVEDSRQMRNVARNMLKQCRRFREIDEAEDGEEAWERIKNSTEEKPYNLVLCDVGMEKLNGIGLLKRCRSFQTYRFLPFLMISGSSEEAYIAAALGEWQANDFIVKPFSLDTLLSRIDLLLRKVDDPEEQLFRHVDRMKDTGSPEEACKLIEKAECEGRLSLAKWVNMKGECLLKAGNIQGAAEEFEKAMSISKIFVAAYKNYASAQTELGEPEKAISALSHIEGISPTDNERTFQLGRLSIQIGEIEEGVKYVRSVIKRTKGDEKLAALKAASQTFLESGLFGEAEKVLGALLDADGADVDTYNRLGMVLRQQGKHDEALNCYQKALRDHPNHAGILHNLGVLFWAKKDYATAAGYLKKAVAIDPNLVEAKKKLDLIAKRKIGTN